jgi:hypothetical protein
MSSVTRTMALLTYPGSIPIVARLLMRGQRVGIPPIISSFLVFASVLSAGLYLQFLYDVVLITRPSLMALAWLAIGPWLIFEASRLSLEFLESYRDVFPTREAWSALVDAHMQRLSTGWMWFAVPWSVLVTSIVATLAFPGVAGPVFAWVVVSFGLLFLISGCGFWGVMALVRLVRDFSSSGIRYRPFHPDRFGGVAAVGTFSARGALYFSSGALVLPLAFDIIDREQRGGTAPVFAYGVTTVFIVFVLAAFILPIMDIKRFADGERVRVNEEARARLEQLMAAYARAPEHDEKLAHQIEMCYQMECEELEKLRPYPYDLKVGVELTLSVAVPIAIVVLETLLR